MVGEFLKKEAQAEQDKNFTEEIRTGGREIADEQGKEIQESVIEDEVRKIITEELRTSLKKGKEIELSNCRGDITGLVEHLEKGEEVTYELFAAASEGSETKMSEGLFNLVKSSFDLLKPVDKIEAMFSFLSDSRGAEVDANIDVYYEEYVRSEKGRERYNEVKREVELKHGEE